MFYFLQCGIKLTYGWYSMIIAPITCWKGNYYGWYDICEQMLHGLHVPIERLAPTTQVNSTPYARAARR